MASFLGSGTSYLDRTCAPIYDRFDYDESEEDDALCASTGSLISEQPAATVTPELVTLDEIGYTFTRTGRGVLLNRYRDEAPPVFKKLKVPHGTKIEPLNANECGICLVNYETSQLVSTDCKHTYCKECIAQYLSVQTGDISNIEHTVSFLETNPKNVGHYLRIQTRFGVVCPHPLCDVIIEGTSFRNCADEATWDRFLRWSLQRRLTTLATRGEIVMCPKQCGGVIQHCECTSPTCEKQFERSDCTILDAYAKTHKARRCPHCSVLIEKVGGCDNMFCTRCQSYYQWSKSALCILPAIEMHIQKNPTNGSR